MKVRLPVILNKRQNKAMNEEINKHILRADHEHHLDTEALILWALHTFPKTRFGKKRLKEFYMAFDVIHQELLEHYSMGDEDATWLAHRKLKEIGVDVRKWHEEARRLRKGNKND
jgi:RPA family protein